MISDWFNNTITWQKPTVAVDAVMTPGYEPYVTVIPDDPCRIDPASSDQKLMYGIDARQTAYTVYTQAAVPQPTPTVDGQIPNGWRGLRQTDTGSDGVVSALRVVGVEHFNQIDIAEDFYIVICVQVILNG
jgi:hypothetical protein